MKRCVLPSGPDDTAKLTRNGFIVMCKARRDHAVGKSQIKREFELPEDYSQCVKCQTGKCVVLGKEFVAPPGVEFKEIGEMMKNTENIGGLPENDVLSQIPGDKIKDLTLSDIKGFWKIPLMKFGEIGVCPNCRREVKGHGKGLCSACYGIGSKNIGTGLIKALSDKRKQFDGSEQQCADLQPDVAQTAFDEMVAPPADVDLTPDLTPAKEYNNNPVAPPELEIDQDPVVTAVTKIVEGPARSITKNITSEPSNGANIRDVQLALIQTVSSLPTKPERLKNWVLKINDQSTRLAMAVAMMETGR